MWIASAFDVAAVAAALALGGCRPAPRPAAAPAGAATPGVSALRGTIARAGAADARGILVIELAVPAPSAGIRRAAGPVRVGLGPRTPVRVEGGRGSGRDALRPGAAVRVYWHGLVIDTDPPLVTGDSVVVERPAP